MAKRTKNSPDKDRIIREFETLKSFELSAHEFYTQLAADPRVSEHKIRDVFLKLASEERRHADLVQEIINLAGDAL